jgi:glutathione reductase (NADPH)
MISAVNQEVDRLNGVYQRMLDNSKVEVFRHYAQFVDSHTLEVGGQRITAHKILIAVGGHPVKPPIPGMENTIVSDDMFHLQEQPKRIVIIGGGYIGVEFACIMHRLGSEVTQIIRQEWILRGFDQDLRTEIQEAMIRHGIRVINKSEPVALEKTPEGIRIMVKGKSEPVAIADAVTLAATGRRASLEGLGLENAGVKVEDSAIVVDQYSRTSVPHIFAVGDCTNRINLTPVAINEGRAVADTEFGGKPRVMSHENVPSAVFSYPEAATVGLTEEQAREKYGDGVRVYKTKFRPMYYTLAGGEEKTMMKLVVDQNSDRVLGAHMVGDSAAEIIQGIAIAIKMGAKKADFDATVGIHPSAAEEFVTMR